MDALERFARHLRIICLYQAGHEQWIGWADLNDPERTWWRSHAADMLEAAKGEGRETEQGEK